MLLLLLPASEVVNDEMRCPLSKGEEESDSLSFPLVPSPPPPPRTRRTDIRRRRRISSPRGGGSDVTRGLVNPFKRTSEPSRRCRNDIMNGRNDDDDDDDADDDDDDDRLTGDLALDTAARLFQPCIVIINMNITKRR